jgi:hypothetical protein
MAKTTLDANSIVDWDTFHDAARSAFGFPDFYGRNMNAFIDCLTLLDQGDGMSRFRLTPHETLAVKVRGANAFATRCPVQALALVTATAAANKRHVADGKWPMLALVYL